MSVEVFDYIIVGAGSAGCVLANKLSASPRNRVLLIEAGGSDQKFWIKVPLGYAKTYSNPKVNWCYNGAPDQGLNGRSGFFPRGRVVGGSSSINAMAYFRGLRWDYDDWEKAGAKGWNWDEVKRTYDAIETHHEIDCDGRRVAHGDGPVWVSDLRDQMHPFSHNFTGAAHDMGWPVLENVSNSNEGGLGFVRSNVRGGSRWSSADAFLYPARKRPNLKILKSTLVEKIILEGGRATGVQYNLGDSTRYVLASKEVILSAGSINSPQLLQLSGIGPGDLLKRCGVDVKHDLPQVGYGLQDHLAVSHFYSSVLPTLNNVLGNSYGRFIAGVRYLLTRGGPLSVPVNHFSGFVRSHKDVQIPDLQIYCNPASYVAKSTGETELDSEAGFLLCAQPTRPTSRGSVCISSKSPLVPPIIQPNSLSTSEDCDAAIRAGKVLQSLAQTPTIRALTKSRQKPDIVGMSEDELLENFRQRAGSVYHPTSTCRMGNDAKDSVLDGQLKVHGINGLRVVDASAFPNVTSGNTNAPTIMLAAKAAGLILNDA